MLNLNLSEPLSDDREMQLIENFTDKVIKRRMESAAILFLEMNKPLAFMTSQMMMVSIPILAPLIGADKMSEFCRLLAKPGSVERIITKIEEKAQANG